MLHCAPIMLCTLLAPDLLLPAPRDARQPSPHAPRLATLLARGKFSPQTAEGTGQWLCERFGVKPQNDWPVAPLTLLADGGDPGDGYWLRCDPVHFHIQQNRMHMNAAGTLTAHESLALIESLNAHFGGDGLLFSAGKEGRCYVRTDGHTKLTTQPVHRVINRAVDQLMPTGNDSGYWRAALNEIQMLLHAHPLNTEREARGLLPFNSVWLWGGGRMPAVAIPPYARVWTNDALAYGLAGRAGTPVSPLPASHAEIFAAGDNALVVLDAISAANADPVTRQSAIEQLERVWFAPSYDALRRGRLSHLTIISASAERNWQFEINRNDLWRFWRRSRPLYAYE